jgi:FKBP-type peptidyl-prolyl cis-trans isomerases 1
MTDDEVKVKKERDPIMMVCFVVFLIASLSVIGASVYNDVRGDDTRVVVGDNVSVDYVGSFYDFYEGTNYVVFDTSRWSVADNNNVPKSNDFTLKAENQYKPLSFKVGGTSVLKMFGDAVVGYKVGDTVRVMIPSGQGYNGPDTLTTVQSSTTYTVPLTEKITASQFADLYGFSLMGTTSLEKSVYGWPAHAAFNTSDNTVTMTYSPVAGQEYVVIDDDFGKLTYKVSSISSTISFTQHVSNYTVVSQTGNVKNIQMIEVDLGTERYFITAVTDTNNDGVSESFTYKTVNETVNEDLYFVIEIKSIN